MKLVRPSIVLASTLLLSAAFANAQDTAAADKASAAAAHNPPTELKVFHLQNMSQPNEANELLTAIRLLLNPVTKLFLDPTTNDILIEAPPDQIDRAQRIIAALDRPKNLYRLTFTVTESDAGKRVGLQHFTMVVASGAHSVLKDGSKVPIATGSGEGSNAQTQITYLDVGLNFDATIQEVNGGFSLKSKIEQSSAAEEHPSAGPQDPIVRQAVLEGTTIVTLGKPLTLGSIDVPGSTRHLDFEVSAELVK